MSLSSTENTGLRGTSANAALAPPTSQGSMDPMGILPPFLQTRVAAAAGPIVGRKRLKEWDLSLSHTLASVLEPGEPVSGGLGGVGQGATYQETLPN